MPLTIPPVIDMAWFKKNMPYKDKLYADMMAALEDLIEEIGKCEANQDFGNLNALIRSLNAISKAAKPRTTDKGVSKEVLGHLQRYAAAAQLLTNQFGKAAENAKATDSRATDALAEYKRLVDSHKATEKAIGPLFKTAMDRVAAYNETKTGGDAAATTAAQKVAKTALEAATARLAASSAYQKHWQIILRVSAPALYAGSTTTPPPKADVESASKRIVTFGKIRDRLTALDAAVNK